MRRVTPWVVAALVVLGCGGMDSLGDVPGEVEDVAVVEPCECDCECGDPDETDVRGDPAEVAERVPDDDGEPLVSDELLSDLPE